MLKAIPVVSRSCRACWNTKYSASFSREMDPIEFSCVRAVFHLDVVALGDALAPVVELASECAASLQGRSCLRRPEMPSGGSPKAIELVLSL